MKTIGFTLAVLIMIFSCKLNGLSQSYQKMIEPEKIWTIAQWQEIMGPPGIVYNTFYARVSDDTLINNATYKKIVYSNSIQFESLDRRVDFVREDSILQKFYVYDTYEDKEKLRYDFAINVTDHVQIDPSFICPDAAQIVESIDTIRIGNKEHRVFYFQNSSWDDVWIEGIGSMLHIVETPCVFDIGYYFLCLEIDGEKMYINPTRNTCYMGNSSTSNLVNQEQELGSYNIIQLKNNIRIDINSQRVTSCQIDIYSISGVKAKSINSNSNIIDINLDYFSNGVYIIKAVSRGVFLFSEKIVIS